jgi:ATP-dependent Clp protease ATP-binding subunit ClpC
MFKRFTASGLRVITLAQEEAKELGHIFVGTEHLLLGLLKDDSSVAFTALKRASLTLADARMEIIAFLGRSAKIPATKTLPFTQSAKKVLQNASAEASEFGQAQVSTEHILFSLLKDESFVYSVLNKCDIDLPKLREDLLNVIVSSVSNEKTVNSRVLANGVIDDGSKDESMVSTFKDFTINLTQKAKANELDPVIGRDKEIERLIQILARRKKNNPILIGEPGVGKTAVVEGLAVILSNGDGPKFLGDKEIISLDLGLLLAGTKFRGDFEDRLQRIIKHVQSSKNIILLIDEVHTLVGAGSPEGSGDAANLLKPALARGEFQCIGATTIEEYRKYIEKDAALARRFQPITIGEPTVSDTILILRGLKSRYERYHQLFITDDALVAAATLGAQFIADRFLPDKAIDLIDEAGARVRIRHSKVIGPIKAIGNELQTIIKAKDLAISLQAFDEAHKYRKQELEMRANISTLKLLQIEKFPKIHFVEDNDIKLLDSDIADVVSSWTGIPVNKMSTLETEKLINMEQLLHERVIGQDVAISAVSRAIRRARVGLKNPNRPIASFIFSGPTGVGKTELTKALALYFFGSEDSMVRLDMSEYMERHTIAKLIGSPPGYVGYDEGGFLTEQVRRKPYTIVLFDEVEKAHPDVFNLLLQILEDGRLTDSQGRLIDFKNTLIILTSNIGAKIIEKNTMSLQENSNIDSLSSNLEYKKMSNAVNEELKQYFKPEFLNRLDEIIVFQQLTQTDVRKITDIMIKQLIIRLSDQHIELQVSDNVKDKLAKDGFNPIYGARPLRRVIMSLLEDPLANLFLEKPLVKGTIVSVELNTSLEIKLTITGVRLINTSNNIIGGTENSNPISAPTLSYEERAAKRRKTLLTLSKKHRLDD